MPVVVIGAGLVAGSYALSGLSPNLHFVLLASSGVLLLYHFDRAFGRSPEDLVNHPIRTEWFLNHRMYVWGSSVLAFLLSAYALIQLGIRYIIPTAILAVVGLSYGLSILPRSARPKTIPVLKTGLIAGAWAYGGVILPILGGGGTWLVAGSIALYRLPLLLANMIITDSVDREGDRIEGIRTTLMDRDFVFVKRAAIALVVFHLIMAMVIGGLYHRDYLFGVDAIGGILAIVLLRNDSMPSSNTVFWMDLIVGWPLVTYGVSVLM